MDSFNTWLGDQPAKYKVITCGNHEYPVEAEPDAWRRRLSNATLLLNESVTIEGIKIWGSPVTPYGCRKRNAPWPARRSGIRTRFLAFHADRCLERDQAFEHRREQFQILL
jgi:hypothetical protein